MAAPDLARVKEIFSQALALAVPDRAAYLHQICGDDTELRAEVEAYLSAADKTDAILGQTVPPPLTERPGTQIGRYKLLEQIGEGGYGVVFMAEQEHPVRRRVALKIIKLGMDTRQVVARFEAERQALAMMDHSGVAKVFDGGATETGRPYFVMELVKGVAITEYCDKNSLSIRARLELFAQVCQAVQHAHQKGLIHRDIKPSNVLVATVDDRPSVKIIDFGIAKATQARLTEKTLFTEFRQMVGTPEYMSPEQTEGGLDIDTRSDVYSLGVLLYELLAGAPPFDPKELRSKAFAEMQRIIREVEPPAPSTKLSTLDALPTIAARRSTEPKKLGSTIRGELDWIVMKCLEKDRARRYGTASGLARDVERYLADEPVQAGRPSAAYRFWKFARRYRKTILAVTTIAVLLVAGTVTSTWLAVRATRARQRADEQAAITMAVNRFLEDMLRSTDLDVRHQVTVVEAMEKASRKLDQGALKDQPQVEAAVRSTINSSVHALALSYSHAVDALPDNQATWSPRSALLTEITRQPILLDEVSKLRPNDKHLRACLARDLIRLQRWKEAIDEYARIIEDLPPADDWEINAALHLFAGDAEGYAKLMSRYAQFDDHEVRKAHMASLSSHPPIAQQQILAWAERAVLVDKGPYCRRVLALAQYRAGQYEKSIESYQASMNPTSFGGGRVFALSNAGLALVRQRQGQPEEAKRLWVEAWNNAMSEGLSGGVGWLDFQLLLRELIILRGAPDISPGILDAQTSSNPWTARAGEAFRDCALEPGSPEGGLGLCVALLKLHRQEEYRQALHFSLAQAATPREGRVLARAAFLLPMEGPDFDLACRLADYAAAETPRFEAALVARALADYRRGRFDSAGEWAARVTSAAPVPAHFVQAQLIQAMAHARSGRTEAARGALAKADELAHRPDPDRDAGGHWWEWAAAEMLHDEAAKLLSKAPPPATVPAIR